MTEVLKNGKYISKGLKETFGKIDVYEFERYTDERRHGSREVYIVSDKRNVTQKGQVVNLKVGVLPTERFYFLFPWDECYEKANGTLDFSKLTGLMELAHGQRGKDTLSVIDYDPFQPPEGKWQIHWVGPHGSIACGEVDATMLTSRIFGTSVIEGNTGEHYYYGKGILYDNKSDCQEASGKYSNSLKYVSGTVSNRNKVMNYRLDKFNVGNEFDDHFNDGVGLVQCSKKVGMVITRNREIKQTSLEELLKSIKKWGFPTNLAFSSCRHIRPEKKWKEKHNQGPMAILALEGQVALQSKHKANAIGLKMSV